MITVEKKNHKTILFYSKKNQSPVALSSRFDPDVEGKRVIEEQIKKKTNMIFLLGLGNFHLALEILKKYQQLPIAFVDLLDEITTHFKNWLKHYPDYLWKRKDVFFLNQENFKEQVIQIIYHFNSYNLTLLKNQKQIYFFNEFYEKAEKEIIRCQRQKKVNRSTISKFEKIWFKNLTKNANAIFSSIPINSLKNWGENKIAVVVGAGPSLKYDLATLKKQQEKIIILAVDTIFKVLINNQIIPDFIISIDPQKINSHYLENLPDKIYQETILIHEPAINNHTIRNFLLRVSFDTIFPLYQLFSAYMKKKGIVEIGGSVVTVALEIIKLLNFKKAIFLGLDLSYAINHYHLPGVHYEQTWFSVINRLNSHEMMINKIINPYDERKTFNRRKEVVFTDTKFELFKNWLERKLPKKNHSYFNGSQTGVNIENLPFLKFSKFCSNFFLENKKEIKNNLSTFLWKEKEKLEKEMSTNLNQINKKLSTLIEELKDNLKKITKLLKNLNLEKKSSLQKIITFQISHMAKPFIEILIQDSIYDFEKKDKPKPNEIIEFYQDIQKAIKFNILYLSKIKVNA